MDERTRQVNIRLTEREYATLAADAQARSMSVSSYVRLMACDHMGVSSTLLYQELVRSRAALVRAREGVVAGSPVGSGLQASWELQIEQCDAGRRRCIGMVLRDY